jgi:inner membrane protein
MDSLTQAVLGAGVAEVTLGHKIGNKALLTGAVIGTIPDLDVLFTGFIQRQTAFLFTGASHIPSFFHYCYHHCWHCCLEEYSGKRRFLSESGG